MAEPPNLRAADADREQLAGELREHMLAGRLSAQEFEERLERAYRASTRGELDGLREDLPMTPAAMELELVKRRARLRRRVVQEAGGGLTASAVCVAVWLLSGAGGEFWPAWVIVFSLLPVARDAWRLLGPAPELEELERRLERRRRSEERRSRRHGPPDPPRPPRLTR